ncbi:MAG: hypothetical protein NWE98_02475 [Candidatus Bathyarchaeota archaeon]|nr:hypothetical protein [Candidatus Bathyarchaeota archaeon]
MNKKTVSTALILSLIIVTLTNIAIIRSAKANAQGASPQLTMPVEYINYTITPINGTLWAKIDGYYQIYFQTQPNCSFNSVLPMVYPMPPQTTNIQVNLDNRGLSWSNYTEAYPEALHHTAVGDWWMIYCLLDNLENPFVLTIHYEHPLQQINGSYLFLYDLNITPYLSPQNSSSTAYFTVRFETNITNIQTYTTKTDTEWNPISFTTTKNENSTVISIPVQSQFDDVPGDLVVLFTADQTAPLPAFPVWAVASVLFAVLLAFLLYWKRQKIGSLSGLSKTAKSTSRHEAANPRV